TPYGVDALSGDLLVRAPVQRELLAMLATAGTPMEKSELIESRASRRGALASLEKAGFVTRVELEPERSADRVRASQAHSRADGSGLTHLGETPPSLSPAQSEAVTAIVANLEADHGPASAPNADGGAVFLLHGVTGSGKTEVYMRVMERVLDSGKDAIMMVPEISLTPQAVNRFTARFPGLVAAVHSRLTDTQRRDAWQRLRSGEARIAVGPRSALFAPLGDIGAIFVDEEHDASYKQDESPR
ncbi:MAG TPA: DEAD/DEAH box helicase family protein, partial [Chloroflexota bacterium]|nr:DEAD/DEAH box helicase family protein [Chloroflexota bacterium]